MKLVLNFIAIISSIISIFLFNLQVRAAQKTITQNCVLPLSQTNWNDTCSVTKFDPALGQLKSVKINVNAQVNSEVKIENQDPQPETITSNVSAQIQIKKPDSGVILNVTPSKSVSDLFGSYDGVLDFGGTSGKSYIGLTSSTTNSSTLVSSGDLNQYIGAGNANMAVSASGQSSFSGSANYVSGLNTSAQASIEITYYYIDSDLSVNKTHTGNFTPGQDATYTLKINNKTGSPTTDPITLVDTLPNGMTYKSVSDSDWTCNANGQIVTCVTNKAIAANDSITFDMVVAVSENTSTNTLNQASVSTVVDDMTPNDNTTSDSTIVNHAPTANNNTVNNIVNAQPIVKLPNSMLSGNPNDANDSIKNYTITSLPNPASGLLYLGDPSKGGVAVALNQVLNPSDLANLYFTPVYGFIGDSSFNYKVTDSFGAISKDPATIILKLISLPGSPISITTTPVNTTQSSNNTQQATTSTTTSIQPVSNSTSTNTATTTSVQTQSLTQTSSSQPAATNLTSTKGEVLGVSESVKLIRTGGNINRLDQFTSIFLYVALMASIYFFVKNWIEL